MGTRYLIDTNALIDYLNEKLPPEGLSFMDSVVDDRPFISIVTKIELLRFNTQEDVYQVLQDFVNDSAVLGLNDLVVEKTIAICRSSKIKLPDAIIAATALVNGLIVISRNISDFKQIADLKILNPHEVKPRRL